MKRFPTYTIFRRSRTTTTASRFAIVRLPLIWWRSSVGWLSSFVAKLIESVDAKTSRSLSMKLRWSLATGTTQPGCHCSCALPGTSELIYCGRLSTPAICPMPFCPSLAYCMPSGWKIPLTCGGSLAGFLRTIWRKFHDCETGNIFRLRTMDLGKGGRRERYS